MKLLTKDSVIGLASPSSLQSEEGISPVIAGLEALGFKVKCAKNLFADSWGFAASIEERVNDLHELADDKTVDMIFFGGGEGGDDIIPCLNYELIKANPKIWMSFSDGTSILNAVHDRTGMNVFYGSSPSDFAANSDYNTRQFLAHLVNGSVKAHEKAAPWRTVKSGKCEGLLLGGYLENFTYLANAGWIEPEKDKDYVLFLEEHQMFFGVEHFSDEIARLENSDVFKQTKGILFGHYSDPTDERILFRLKILADKYDIPVAYCDDFGHGKNRAVFEIGAHVSLDTEKCELMYL